MQEGEVHTGCESKGRRAAAEAPGFPAGAVASTAMFGVVQVALGCEADKFVGRQKLRSTVQGGWSWHVTL